MVTVAEFRTGKNPIRIVSQFSRYNYQRGVDRVFLVLYNPSLDNSELDWLSMGGSVGYTSAEFLHLEDAVKFVATGLNGEKTNENIWLDMLSVPKEEVI